MKIIRALCHKFIPQKMPDLVIKYYEKLIDRSLDFYLNPFCEEVLKAYPGKTRILDIGTGTGQLPIMLAQANESYQLTALDLSEKCLNVARSKAASAHVASRITFSQLDLSKDAFNVEPFDLIISTCSMHHWQQPIETLKNARRLLKNSGQIWILDDVAEASCNARREWVSNVERTCHRSWLFRTVFGFESRFIAYSRPEIEEICEMAKLNLIRFSTRDVFFFVQISRD